MKADYTHIQIVLDRSGSMEGIRDDVIGGLNTFMEEQSKGPGTCTVGLAQFDDEYEVIYERVPIANIAKRTRANYVPRNNTALLDAIGRTINALGTNLGFMDESQRPSKVIFLIQTDGMENASREFTRARIFEMIKHQQEAYNWEFVFLGANQDAIATATSMGISGQSAASYNGTPRGVSATYATLNASVMRSRMGGQSVNCDFTPEEQQVIANTK